jgi:predicted ATPase
MTTLSFTQVEIDGFRGLRSLNLEGLGRVNILVGKNNCGKTSVLEALSILCNPQNPDEWLAMVNRRDFGGMDETLVQSLRWCFTQNSSIDYDSLTEASCRFKWHDSSSLKELRVEFKEFLGVPNQEDIKRSRPIFRENKIEEKIMKGCELEYLFTFIDEDCKKIRPLRVWENLPYRRLGSFKHNSVVITPYSYQLNSRQLRAQSKQLFNDVEVVELLRKFDDDIEGIRTGSFSGTGAAIYIKHRKLGIAPLSIFGDAIRRAVLLAYTLLSLEKGNILLIDEVEVGIHVGVLTNIFKWLVDLARKLEIQIFVTTHSLETLDAITFSDDDLAEEDIVVFRLKQTAEKTESKRLSGDLLHRLRFERGLDVR